MKVVNVSEIREAMDVLKANVSGMLPNIPTSSKKRLAYVLLVYRGLIEPNFVPMLTNVWTRCRTEAARKACADNILCEVSEDHPQMLRNFVQPALKYASLSEVDLYIRNGDGAMERLNNVTWNRYVPTVWGLIVLASLENASLAFIPWLQEAAEKLGVTDFTYTQKHGVADIEHANQFLQAVEEEATAYDGSEFELQRPIKMVEDVLLYIFHAHRRII